MAKCLNDVFSMNTLFRNWLETYQGTLKNANQQSGGFLKKDKKNQERANDNVE